MTKGKPIKSDDPYKAVLVKAIKEQFNATKVTNVRDLGNGRFSANLFRKDHAGRGGQFTALGTRFFSRNKEECL
jgi:hypothetical protein